MTFVVREDCKGDVQTFVDVCVCVCSIGDRMCVLEDIDLLRNGWHWHFICRSGPNVMCNHFDQRAEAFTLDVAVLAVSLL